MKLLGCLPFLPRLSDPLCSIPRVVLTALFVSRKQQLLPLGTVDSVPCFVFYPGVFLVTTTYGLG